MIETQKQDEQENPKQQRPIASLVGFLITFCAFGTLMGLKYQLSGYVLRTFISSLAGACLALTMVFLRRSPPKTT